MFNLNQADEADERLEVGRKISTLPAGAKSWLGPDGALSDEDLERLLAPIQKDPRGAALVAEAVSLAGLAQARELIQVIHPCGSDTRQAGLTSNLRKAWTLTRLLPDAASSGHAPGDLLARTYHAEIEKIDRGVQASPGARRFYDASPDRFRYILEIEPTSICIQASLTPADAAEALFHELVHYVKMANRLEPEPDVLGYASEYEFLVALISVPGGELEAFVEQYEFKARQARLGAGSRPVRDEDIFWEPDLRALFPGGRFNGDREAMAKYILQGGLGRAGYQTGGIGGAYAVKLQSEMRKARAALSELATLVAFRQAEAKAYPHLQSAAEASIRRLGDEKSRLEDRLLKLENRLKSL